MYIWIEAAVKDTVTEPQWTFLSDSSSSNSDFKIFKWIVIQNHWQLVIFQLSWKIKPLLVSDITRSSFLRWPPLPPLNPSTQQLQSCLQQATEIARAILKCIIAIH